MKLLFFSDSHGSAAALGDLTLRIAGMKPDLILMLGDALYHGPRNALPSVYDGKKAAEMLNVYKNRMIAVRGNCDSEVDQMMLSYPMMSDYSTLVAETGHRFFLTHGHLWNENNLPPIPAGTILAHGHTHVPVLKTLENGITVFNPGSIAIPKQGNTPTFGWWCDGELSVRDLKNGEIYRDMNLKF